ncbi:DUF3817 domain-containing protein [Ichthyobacterium seriolicida]|uniref:DUF3817 domain-containing protein n=1 Tax=Ichthyobacterium seriolicida TaxID=242600 RepID=UPI000BBCB5A6|nr:DUF3817 domain-containing protein [Ichthyobacterium seriolicida]
MSFFLFFRVISALEGLSLLILFGIAMPFKYILQQPVMVEVVGMIHGILFIIYVLSSFLFKIKTRCTWKDFCIMVIASVVPFGAIYIDRKYLS